MAKKQRWVNVREARLLDQAIQKNSFRYLTLDEHKVVDKAYLAMKDSELYKTVWDKVEKEAVRIVEEKCKPEWNRISEEMKPLGELRNKLAEKKAKGEWWTDEDEAQLNGLDKEMADLANTYNEVTTKANAELNEYKEKVIAETEWAAFMLYEDEYQLVWELVGRVLPTNDK